MSSWKTLKDRAAIDRLRDERLHALAVREIESGVRRDGLWAKALIRIGPDESRVKLEYLRLLVQHLKDEHYVTEREREGQAAKRQAEAVAHAEEAQQVRDQQEREEARARASSQYIQANLSHLLMLCGKLRAHGLGINGYESLLNAVGGTLRYEGFIWGSYIVSYGSMDIPFRSLRDLRPWFIEYVLPAIEAKA